MSNCLQRAHPGRRSDWARFILLTVGLTPTCACTTLMETGGPNAVGVQVAKFTKLAEDRSTPEPAPDEVKLGDFFDASVSYSRRFKGDRKLWLGPEAVVGWSEESKLSAARAEYPAGVSRSFAAVLLRLNTFPVAEEQGGWADNFFGRVGLGFAAGLSYERFSESERLISGAVNPRRRVDGVFGPVVGFGLDFRVTKHLVFRAGGYYFFLEPELSFPWPKDAFNKTHGGVGLVVAF
jgi:hypothetical protein